MREGDDVSLEDGIYLGQVRFGDSVRRVNILPAPRIVRGETLRLIWHEVHDIVCTHCHGTRVILISRSSVS